MRALKWLGMVVMVGGMAACGGGGGGDGSVTTVAPTQADFEAALNNYRDTSGDQLFSWQGKVAQNAVAGTGSLSVDNKDQQLFNSFLSRRKTSTYSLTFTSPVNFVGEPIDPVTSISYFNPGGRLVGSTDAYGYKRTTDFPQQLPSTVSASDKGTLAVEAIFSDSSFTTQIGTQITSYEVSQDATSSSHLILNFISDALDKDQKRIALNSAQFLLSASGELTRLLECRISANGNWFEFRFPAATGKNIKSCSEVLLNK